MNDMLYKPVEADGDKVRAAHFLSKAAVFEKLLPHFSQMHWFEGEGLVPTTAEICCRTDKTYDLALRK